MRHAKPTNIKESYAQLLIIYGSIDLILHGLIPALTPDITPDQFIQACEAQQEIWNETAKFHLRSHRQSPSQPSRQPPKPSGYRSNPSSNRYNAFQPPYRLETYNPAYRNYPQQSPSGYSQQGGYHNTPPPSNSYGKQPTHPPLPPARQPLQIIDGTSSTQPPADTRPYGTNRPSQQAGQSNLRPFQSRTFHGRPEHFPEQETFEQERDITPES